MVGKVSSLLGFTTMPNGLMADSAEVTLSEEEKVVVPLANLEILE